MACAEKSQGRQFGLAVGGYSANHGALIIMFAQPAIAALNHLLVQNSWALPRLSRFAGKTVRFEIVPFSFSCSVCGDGRLRTADTDASADVLCRLVPSLLPRLATHDEQAYSEIYSEGDQALLSEIFF